MKRKSFIIFLMLLLPGCRQHPPSTVPGWKTIDIGRYLIDVPPDMELHEAQGTDSYVGQIDGDSLSIGFDYGYFSSDFGPDVAKYLERKSWLDDLLYRHPRPGMSTDPYAVQNITILALRHARTRDSIVDPGCDYIASCSYGRDTFDGGIYIPAQIKSRTFTVDTVGSMYRKMVTDKTFAGIYLSDLSSFDSSMNSRVALSMASARLTPKSHARVRQIFRTVRMKTAP